MPITEERYIQLALEDPEGKWELIDGCPRRKPAMSWEHNHTGRKLTRLLNQQLDPDTYEVANDSGRVRRSARNYFVPDVYVVPMDMARRLFHRPGMLESYPEPLPFVAEVWSPSTGDYDVTEKLEEYKRRGDLEVWLIHPYVRTVTAWRRDREGNYAETMYRGGIVEPAFLPNVRIDLDTLLS